MEKLTKSLFRKYLGCPREFWLKEHHPEVIASEITADIKFRIRQGYELERIIKESFTRVEGTNYQFQKSVQSERLLARFDVFVENAGDGGSYIYEIKSSKFIDPANNRRKADRLLRLYDVGFQVFAARESGLEIAKAFLITLNGEYRLGDSLDVEELLKIEDVTEEVEDLQTDIGDTISAAFELLENEPEEGFDNLCSKKLDCEYFAFKMDDLPHPNIFNVPRLNKNKASQLLSMDILALNEIPEDFQLTPTQRDYLEFVKNDEKVIDREAIKERLSELKYPLYFLDYETVNPSIPQFEGMSPLQQITFQYSLHVLESEDSELKHFEFLSNGDGIPPKEVAENLSKEIDETGSVLVWYKSFEMGRNREMAELYPEFADFMQSVNERVFDLYEIFSKKLYRDPAFKGNSIKSILPVLVPHLSYDEMEIGDGATAMSRWYDEVYSEPDERRKTEVMKRLKEYCRMDTLAMVEILEVLRNL